MRNPESKSALLSMGLNFAAVVLTMAMTKYSVPLLGPIIGSLCVLSALNGEEHE